jgi:zinc transporter 5/7
MSKIIDINYDNEKGKEKTALKNKIMLFNLSNSIKQLMISKESTILLLFIIVLSIFVIIQISIGLYNKSLHIIADAFHGFLHIGAFLFSLIALNVAKKSSNINYTFGYTRIETLSAFSNCFFMYFLTMFLAFRKLHHLFEDESNPISQHQHQNDHHHDENTMIIMLLIKLLINLGGGLSFSKYFHYQVFRSLNEFDISNGNYEKYYKYDSHFENLHTVFLHFSLDALCNICELVFLSFKFFEENYLDIIITSFIMLFTFYICYHIIIITSKILLQAFPIQNEKEVSDILKEINLIDGVLNISENKFWAMSGVNLISSFKLRIRRDADINKLNGEIKEILKKNFKVSCIELNKEE